MSQYAAGARAGVLALKNNGLAVDQNVVHTRAVAVDLLQCGVDLQIVQIKHVDIGIATDLKAAAPVKTEVVRGHRA